MIYNRTLNTGEIQFLYNSNLTKYDTNRWTFTTNRNNLDTSFSYSGRVKDLAGGATGTETRTITIDSIPPRIIFTGTTPANGAMISGNWFIGQVDITELNLKQFMRTRSGTSYPIYNIYDT